MKFRLNIVLMTTLFVVQISLAAVADKDNLCKVVDNPGNVTLCSPDKDWLYMGDKDGNGHVWLHKNREGEKINSFILTVDKENTFDTFDNYINFVKSEFKRLNIVISQEKIVDSNFAILKLSTPDKKIEFFQAYKLLAGKTWTMSCMGPNQSLIDRDCPELIKSLSIKK